MKTGIDYSWEKPDASSIASAGFQFVMRYVDYPGANGKGISKTELDSLRANGLAVGLVYESTEARALDGFAAGAADALPVRDELNALGWPDDRPVYFAVDFDAQPAQYPLIASYFAGVASVSVMNSISRIGIYGGYDVLEWAHDNAIAGYFWQSLAWAHGKGVYPNASIHQFQNGEKLDGKSVDYNVALNPDYGVWEVDNPTRTVEERVAALEHNYSELNRYILARFGIISNAAATAANPDLSL